MSKSKIPPDLVLPSSYFDGFSQLGSPSDSTCSADSYLRGAGQKIIGFSFYGNPYSTKGKERKYFKVGKYHI